MARSSSTPIPKNYSIAEARNLLGALIHKAEAGPVELTRRGEPVAMIVSLADYRRLTGNRGFWDAAQDFRVHTDPKDLDDGDLFSDVRDRSPGREIKL